MTKVSVLGKANEEKKELKKIELKFHCNDDDIPCSKYSGNPSNWGNVILIKKSFYNRLDLIVVYDDKGGDRSLMLGHWNDGII